MLVSVSLFPMLVFQLNFQYFSNIFPMIFRCLSNFGISEFFPVNIYKIEIQLNLYDHEAVTLALGNGQVTAYRNLAFSFTAH